MEMIKIINKIVSKFGYTIVPNELIDRTKNELASLVDAIKIYESKEVDND
jgi:hypothetical protein